MADEQSSPSISSSNCIIEDKWKHAFMFTLHVYKCCKTQPVEAEDDIVYYLHCWWSERLKHVRNHRHHSLHQKQSNDRVILVSKLHFSPTYAIGKMHFLAQEAQSLSPSAISGLLVTFSQASHNQIMFQGYTGKQSSHFSPVSLQSRGHNCITWLEQSQ